MRSRGGHHHGQHDPYYGSGGGGGAVGDGNSYYGSNNNNYGGGGGGGYSPYGAGPPAPGGSPGPSTYGGGYGGGGSSSYNNSNSNYQDYSNSNYQDYSNATMPSYGGGSSNADYGNDADDSHNKYKKMKKQSMNESIVMHGICLGILTLLAIYLTFGCYWNISKQYTQILELDDFSSSNRGRKKPNKGGPKKLSNLVDKFNELKKRRQEVEDELNQIDNGGGGKSKEVGLSTQDQETRLNDLKKQQQQLTKERDELKKKHEGPEKKEAEARMSQRQRAYQQRVQKLVAATRRESKRAVLERFGPGPHQVELLFPIPGGGDNKGGSGGEVAKTFTVLLELAPLSATPHAIHLFLEQIEHGLWDKEHVHVYLNSDHVLQIGPKIIKEEEEVDNDDEYVRSSQIPFQEADLDTLAFPDYSDEYPHEEWTIGFAGRPGGPDIYINKIDNGEIHGPGGQLHHALAEEQGDSCFGKVIKGQSEIQRYLYSLPTMTDVDWGDYVIDPVPIIEAKIVSERPRKDDEVIVDMDASTSAWTTPKDLHRFHEDIVSVVAALDLITSLEVIEDEIVAAAIAAAAENETVTDDANVTEQVSRNVDYVYGDHPPNENVVDTDEKVTKNTQYVYGDHPPAVKKGDDGDGTANGDTTTEKVTKNTQYVYGDHPPADTAKGGATNKDVPRGGGTSGTIGSWY